MGRREPARLRRVPARVVAQPPASRRHARPARAARAAADLGRRPPELHLALPRAALGAGDAGAAGRARAGAAAVAARRRSSPAPKACRSTRSRPCGCCSTAASWSRTAPPTRSSGEVETLEVPETLHALIAARLDGLSPEERRLVQDAAVLGKTFTPAVARRPDRAAEAELEPLLAGLVRKEVLGLQADPRSPEHGQYGFLQDLVRRVAYETLPKRDRRAKHLAAAEHLAGDARRGRGRRGRRLAPARGLPPRPGRCRRRGAARGMRTRALLARRRTSRLARRLGRGAALLRAGGRARRRAPRREAAALDARRRDGTQRRRCGRRRVALRASRSLCTRRLGDTHAAGRATAWLASPSSCAAIWTARSSGWSGPTRSIGDDEPDADLAFLLVRLGSAHWFCGESGARRATATERGLEIAEALRLPECSFAAGDEGEVSAVRKPQEARALHQLALDTARTHELAHRRRRGLEPVGPGFQRRPLRRVARLSRAGAGARAPDRRPAAGVVRARRDDLRADDARALGRGARTLGTSPTRSSGDRTSRASSAAAEVYLHRGELAPARELLVRFEELRSASDVQSPAAYAAAEAAVSLAEGRSEAALEAAERAVATRDALGVAAQDVKQGIRLRSRPRSRSAGEKGRRSCSSFVENLPAGLRPPFLDATARRFRARVAERRAGRGRRLRRFGEWTAAADCRSTSRSSNSSTASGSSANRDPTDARSVACRGPRDFERLRRAPVARANRRSSRRHTGRTRDLTQPPYFRCGRSARCGSRPDPGRSRSASRPRGRGTARAPARCPAPSAARACRPCRRRASAMCP